MARRVQEAEWEDDDGVFGQDGAAADDGGPGEHDRHLTENDEQEVTVKCPGCGKRVWADAERCPKCGTNFAEQAWNSREAGAWRAPKGLAWTVFLLLAAMAGWLLGKWL
jgi:hypothetical protein